MYGEPVPAAEEILAAAQALRRGELVVFPTETVYGLGAHALDEDAVARVFAAKGRPADNPLIVHVATLEQARAIAARWPPIAERLATEFWPGPLTLVLPRAPHVPDATTGGLDSVALRIPDHPVALALLTEAALPVAAPSANRSGRPSPTRVTDAQEDLGGSVAVYLDGGATKLGLESTVVSLVGERPLILRQGALTRETLERAIGPVDLAHGEDADTARSPGTRYRHYAPRARVHLVAGSPDALVARAEALRAGGERVAILASSDHPPEGRDVRILGARDDGRAWAHALYATLRDLDHEGYAHVVVEALPETHLNAAVMDRLRRAAQAGGG